MSDLYKMLDIYNMSILCNMLGKENMPDVFYLMLGYIFTLLFQLCKKHVKYSFNTVFSILNILK